MEEQLSHPLQTPCSPTPSLGGSGRVPMPVSLPKMMSSQSPGGRAYIQASGWGIRSGAGGQLGNPNTASLPPLSSPTSDSAFPGGRGAPSCSVSGLGLGPAALVPDSLLPKSPKFNAFQEVTTRLGSEGSLQGAVLRGPALGFRARLGAREHSGLQS